MCFSAGASFGASAVLGTIGIISVVKAKTNPRRLFATIPLIFSVQQLTEGFIWLSLKDPGLATWQPLLTYIFLVFAMAVWPFWIPLTVRLLEKEAKLKKRMNVMVGIGAAVSVVVICVLSLYHVRVTMPMDPGNMKMPMDTSPVTMPLHHHLHYSFNFPPVAKNLIGGFTLLYCLATIITPFISSIKKMKWLGIVFFASYLFAVIFYNSFVLSVWCFFAAILSTVVLWIIMDMRKKIKVNSEQIIVP